MFTFGYVYIYIHMCVYIYMYVTMYVCMYVNISGVFMGFSNGCVFKKGFGLLGRDLGCILYAGYIPGLRLQTAEWPLQL